MIAVSYLLFYFYDRHKSLVVLSMLIFVHALFLRSATIKRIAIVRLIGVLPFVIRQGLAAVLTVGQYDNLVSKQTKEKRR